MIQIFQELPGPLKGTHNNKEAENEKWEQHLPNLKQNRVKEQELMALERFANHDYLKVVKIHERHLKIFLWLTPILLLCL